MNHVRRIFFVGTLALLLILGCGKEEDKAVPERAPDFILKDLNGDDFRLADSKGKVVVLNFFATWCKPCREEIPGLIWLYKKFNDKGLEIVGVGLDMEGADILRPFVQEFRIPYPVVVATREMVLDYGGIKGIPSTFLIDRNGLIAQKLIGFVARKALEKSVVELLREKG
jgi:cytochrome c biogenesis protein CcmG/thiol:disulfide interchange protein DsbE